MALVRFLGGLFGALWRERRWNQEQIYRLRDARLRRLVMHAKSTSVLWNERLQYLNCDLPINLAQIQPITKDEIMERFNDSISGGKLTLPEVRAFTQNRSQVGRAHRGNFVLATTSGTTGRVGYFVSDLSAFAEMNGALFARILRHRLIPREILRFCFGRRYRMAMAVATDGHFITRLVAGFKPVLTRSMVNTKLFSIMDTLESVVHQLNLFRPHYLHGYPTYLEALAHERMEGRLAIEPEFISLGSEPVSTGAKKAIAQAFPSAQLSETYGATECLAIANQCSAGRLHLNEDLVIVEPVDSKGRPVPVGVPSDKIYLTNLVNRAQPLLRYEISDSVTLLGDDCPCGSPMRSIRVDGRADDTIFLEDATGRWHAHPPVPFEALFLGIRGLRQYQLVHEAQNKLRVFYVPDRGADSKKIAEALREAFAEYLDRNHLSGMVEVAIEETDGIERESVGHKLRQIYSKVPRPQRLTA